MIRRNFLKQSTILASGALFVPALIKATSAAPVIMIVSGWQDVNIGDITHTPGLITLIRHRIPKARIILWKKSDSKKVDDMLMQYFPEIKIVHGGFDKDFVPGNDDVKKAFMDADFFLHGSGPSLVGADYIRSWLTQTKKPFGIFGVTLQDINPSAKELLKQATFIFTRETASIEVLRKNGLAGEHIAFAPDATFVLDINDDKTAIDFLKSNGLEDKKFICAIPRLRYTPYYKWSPGASWTDKRIKEVEAVNEQFKELDHAKLREAIIAWVRNTGNKVLICPEMTYQLDIMDELLINPLPDDVRSLVQKRGFWLPDEAASVYARAHAVLSFECHSPYSYCEWHACILSSSAYRYHQRSNVLRPRF